MRLRFGTSELAIASPPPLLRVQVPLASSRQLCRWESDEENAVPAPTLSVAHAQDAAYTHHKQWNRITALAPVPRVRLPNCDETSCEDPESKGIVDPSHSPIVGPGRVSSAPNHMPVAASTGWESIRDFLASVARTSSPSSRSNQAAHSTAQLVPQPPTLDAAVEASVPCSRIADAVESDRLHHLLNSVSVPPSEETWATDALVESLDDLGNVSPLPDRDATRLSWHDEFADSGLDASVSDDVGVQLDALFGEPTYSISRSYFEEPLTVECQTRNRCEHHFGGRLAGNLQPSIRLQAWRRVPIRGPPCPCQSGSTSFRD